jgi:8-oxo-dGTP diphosphatase
MPTEQDRYVAHGLIEHEGKYLVLRRRDGRYLGGQWDIPGGTVEAGESPAEAAVRECVEEAGIRTTVGPEIAHYENTDTEGRPLVFHTLTYLLRPEPGVLDVVLSVNEHDDFRWVLPSEALGMPLVWHVERTFRSLLN